MTDKFFVILDHFLYIYLPPPSPSTTQRIKILKEMKKNTWNISSFCNSVPKIMTICYTVYEIWCMTDVITFHFGSFLPKDIIILYICSKNYDQMMYGSRDMVHDRRMERRPDGKTDIQRGGCPTWKYIHKNLKYTIKRIWSKK